MICLLLRKCYLCGHATEGLKLYLCQDSLPVIQFQVVVLEALDFNDSFISYYRDDIAVFKIEFHVPIVCPFIEFVKTFLECSCVYLRLKSYIHYGVISKKSNCRNILSGMSLL